MPEHGLRWANVERLVVQWLRSRTTATVYTETGSDLDAVARAGGAILVQRSGGSTAVISKDIDVELWVYAGTRAEMWALVARVESVMFDLAADATDEGYVDDVVEAFGFSQEPYSNQAVRRATATYQLTVRPKA